LSYTFFRAPGAKDTERVGQEKQARTSAGDKLKS
jgi:hypothetical protein